MVYKLLNFFYSDLEKEGLGKLFANFLKKQNK